MLILAASGSNAGAVTARSVSSPFIYGFGESGILEESGQMQESASPYWWVNSGGQLVIANGVGMTIQGDLPLLNKWRALYAASNPTDTDIGAHPQNIFRLVSRSRWLNVKQSVVFRINRLNMSASPQRGEWSGILLFNRYLNGDNLYYVGIRHDGKGVIKKKRFGTYFTLAQAPVFKADAPYERDSVPNVMPGKRWIGMRSVVQSHLDGTVTLQLWVDPQNTQKWQRVLEVIDASGGEDGAPIMDAGYGGLRTDFMDAEFDNYRAEIIY